MTCYIWRVSCRDLEAQEKGHLLVLYNPSPWVHETDQVLDLEHKGILWSLRKSLETRVVALFEPTISFSLSAGRHAGHWRRRRPQTRVVNPKLTLSADANKCRGSLLSLASLTLLNGGIGARMPLHELSFLSAHCSALPRPLF